MGDLGQAEIWLKKALELEETDSEILDHMFDVLQEKGANNEAIEYLERAVRAEPNSQKLQKKLKKQKSLL